MSAYGFAYHSPGYIRSLLEGFGKDCAVVGSVADARSALCQSTCSILLWERLDSFSRFNSVPDDCLLHLFFSDLDSLSNAGVICLDSDTFVTSSLLSILSDRDLPSSFLSYMKDIPQLPEMSFSREVKKTQAKKKKDTDPNFVAGAPLRQGIKDILDMCGHAREPITHFHILSYILFLTAPEGLSVELNSFSPSELERVRSAPEWSLAKSGSTASAIGAILALMDGYPDPLDGASYEDRTIAAFHQLHQWLTSSYSSAVLAALLQVINGVPERMAAFVTQCDVSSLNILCRNLSVLRPRLVATSHFYKLSN